MKRRNLLAGAAMRLRRLIGFAVPLLLLLGGAQGAWAACSRYPGAETKTINMGMGNVLIPNELAVGGTIATKDFAIPVKGLGTRGFDIMWTCPGGGVLKSSVLQGTASPDDTAIYSTTVTGVGVRLSVKYSTADGFRRFPYVGRVPSGTGGIGFLAGAQFRVELIKTAAVTGNGPLAAGTYTTFYGDGDSVSMLTSILAGNGTTIITPSCTVDMGSRNIPVAFGKVPQSDFKGKGSTAADRNFNIKLNCKAGQNAQNTVLLRMDAQADLSNVQGVLRLTQAGTATAGGVGIQVVDGTAKTPVKFGDAAVVGPSKEGSYVLPYTARYYQTGDKVTPGRANGTATFTLDYK